MIPTRVTVCFLVLAFVAATASLSAAEITLKPRAQPAGASVLLGDVAEIDATDAKAAQALRRIELIPAPQPGQTRVLKLREIQDLLALQGVRPTDHDYFGAPRVEVAGTETSSFAATASAPTTATARQVQRRVAQQTQKRVTHAIASYLEAQTGKSWAWEVVPELTQEQIQLLGNHSGELSISGGSAPWTGKQRYTVVARSSQGQVRLDFLADVQAPEAIVVARRPLLRGQVIVAADVELKSPELAAQHRPDALHSLEEAIGRETTRSIATGQALEPALLRKPILVRRGELVTVTARAANLSVRIPARAVDEGASGDLVTVERLDDRKRFTARVTGVQELEVLTGSVRVTSK